MALNGKVALVTGASRGIGKGIALQLAEAGALVYITARTITCFDNDELPGSLSKTVQEIKSRGGNVIAVACDLSKDEEIEKLFQQIKSEQGKLDILINNAFDGIKALLENLGKPFWEIPESIWYDVNSVGLKDHYMCAVKAAKLMTKQKSGLIVNISSNGGMKYLFTPAYGVGKVGLDRMAADCALELKPYKVAFVSLWPGRVLTENFQQKVVEDWQCGKKVKCASQETLKLGGNATLLQGYEEGESIEFAGKCIVALIRNNKLMDKSGKVLTTAGIGKEFDIRDVDGRRIEETV